MSDTEIQMITRAIENLEKKVDSLIGSFSEFCSTSADKFARLDVRIQGLEQNKNDSEKNKSSDAELGRWKKEWNLKKWLTIISFISLTGVVITIINVILGWIGK